MKVVLIMPSRVMARGIEGVFHDLGEFRVEGILSDISSREETTIKNMNADAVIVDPIIFAHSARSGIRQMLSEYTDAAIVAFPSGFMNDETSRQYDAVLNLYDSPAEIIHKLRAAVSAPKDNAVPEGSELSPREKEILVCVAKGMINKEIADLYNISIHTVIAHRRNITRKTGIKTVAGLTVYALLNNLIDGGGDSHPVMAG